MSYEWNEVAAVIATGLIEKYHPHLSKTKIAYLFKVKSQPASGRSSRKSKKKVTSARAKKEIWAKAALVPAKYVELLKKEYVFVLEFDRTIWDGLTKAQQTALVDHELCHCGNDSNGPYMRIHDVEEFREIVNRHGFWRDSVRLFAESCGPLFDAAGKPKPIEGGELRQPRRSTRPLREPEAQG